MREADQYVTPEARYAEQVDEASGVRHQVQGAPPYPLYGLSDDLTAVPLWQRPWFCYTAGGLVGVGLGYALSAWILPFASKMKKNAAKKKSAKLAKKKRLETNEDDE